MRTVVELKLYEVQLGCSVAVGIIGVGIRMRTHMRICLSVCVYVSVMRA